MTNDDKALVERLRDEDSYYRIQESHWCIDAEELERQRQAAADRIEALSAEVERLLNLLRDCDPESMSWLDARDEALGEQ